MLVEIFITTVFLCIGITLKLFIEVYYLILFLALAYLLNMTNVLSLDLDFLSLIKINFKIVRNCESIRMWQVVGQSQEAYEAAHRYVQRAARLLLFSQSDNEENYQEPDYPDGWR